MRNHGIIWPAGSQESYASANPPQKKVLLGILTGRNWGANMSYKDYEVVDDPGSPAGQQFGGLANAQPNKASRLLTEVVDCVDSDGASGERMATGSGNPIKEEVYLVPHSYLLASIPDAAALIRIDHTTQKIEFVEIYDMCGGPGYGWNPIRARAAAALKYP